ncbi:MAG: hypothetical protein CMJ78_25660 [Planctomycetaceae bacterium]|nr:hypothetical protein [Planctomycetaceae bacterium]
MSDEASTLSINNVVILLMILVALFAWAMAAAGYAHDAENWRKDIDPTEDIVVPAGRKTGRVTFLIQAGKALLDFLWNAIVQVPNCVAVISTMFSDRLWLVILTGVLEGGIFAGGHFMKKLEKQLAADPRMPRPTRKKKNSKKRKRRTPDGSEL